MSPLCFLFFLITHFHASPVFLGKLMVCLNNRLFLSVSAAVHWAPVKGCSVQEAMSASLAGTWGHVDTSKRLLVRPL